ncbi:MAG: monothiol glutaredoxin [Myxococcota bacterium]|jgi:monothiol glutaredoxin
MDRPIFEGGASSSAAAYIEGFHADLIREISDAVDRDAVVVLGMAQNPHVGSARKALKSADVPFTYIEHGSYLSKWKERLAIKMWSGWPTFPQVYVHGVLIGGSKRLLQAIADGSLKERLGAGRSTPASDAV